MEDRLIQNTLIDNIKKTNYKGLNDDLIKKVYEIEKSKNIILFDSKSLIIILIIGLILSTLLWYIPTPTNSAILINILIGIAPLFFICFNLINDFVKKKETKD